MVDVGGLCGVKDVFFGCFRVVVGDVVVDSFVE